MAELIAVAFDDPEDAFAAREALLALSAEGGDAVEGPAVVKREAGGDFTLAQGVNPVSAAAVGGTLLGAVIGAAFLNPLAGAVLGAGAGAAAGAATEGGLDDIAREELRAMVPVGGAAALLVVSDGSASARGVVGRVGDAAPRGRVARRTLSDSEELRLRALLDSEAPSV
jgi:uncharacterized membrane protein